MHELTRASDSAEIGSAVLAVARSLGLDTIAEGVERETQAPSALGCQCAQGLWFAPPMDPLALATHQGAGKVLIPR